MEEQEDRRRKTQRSELVLVGFLFLFGIGSILFGVARLKGSILRPFQLSNIPEQTGSLLDGVDQGGVDVEGLKAKDTDGDGLNDYQETYIVQTSPYLADTDGDGISDKEEVTRGSDPNCPEGKECFQGTVAARAPLDKTVPAPYSGTPSPADAKNGSNTDPAQAINQVLQQFQNKTPQQIRDFLKTQGMPEEQINQIPDVLLQSIYNQGIEKAVADVKQKGIQGLMDGAKQLSGSAGTAPTVSSISPEKLANPSLMSPQEIRILLEQSGKVPLDVLKKVPDSALKDIFIKAVQSTTPPK